MDTEFEHQLVTDKELTWLFKNKWNIYKRSEGKKLF